MYIICDLRVNLIEQNAVKILLVRFVGRTVRGFACPTCWSREEQDAKVRDAREEVVDGEEAVDYPQIMKRSQVFHIKLRNEELERIDRIRREYAYTISRTAVVRRALSLLFEKERV